MGLGGRVQAGDCMKPLILPLRTYSLANEREHWTVRAKRAKGQRNVAAMMMPKVSIPCTIRLTRISPGTLDSDNLAISQKHVRDGIADKLGIDDRDPRVTWEYAQERSAPKVYAVRVEVVDK